MQSSMLKTKTMKNTVGLIFCSGYGKRLLPYTKITPKPILLKHSRKSFLEINIEKLLEIGIEKIYVSYSYGYNLFTRIIQKYNGKVQLIYENHPVGQGKTICNLLPEIKKYKYLYTANGDTIMEYDSSGIYDYIVENNIDLLISSSSNSEVEKNLLIDENRNLYGCKTHNKEYLYVRKSDNVIYANSLGDNVFSISSLTNIYNEASIQDFLGFYGENDLVEILLKHKHKVKVLDVVVHSYHSINTVDEFKIFNKNYNA